ncbi:ribosomal protein L32 [Venturia nashicola]|uniref:Large ribosomal subunit protein bL32m n=1 Tax=Venturia nashicola TaxID=86259 RepID=A0A4Z1NBL6_9PEZI|nr:ribosomal protein L32 [Venturia nashicola]TLD14568.1 ribosomal protein L32 [Venturia nashicola]
MALRLPPIHSIIQLLEPAATRQPSLTSPFLRRIPTIPTRALAIPITAFAAASDFLREIWEGILKAVPKKKTSHMKKRHRQMAGKGLKDVTALNKCSACGKIKQAHTLCPYCVQAVRLWMKSAVGINSRPVEEPSKDRYNLAEHSPVWQHIKKEREKAAKEKKEKREKDYTKW